MVKMELMAITVQMVLTVLTVLIPTLAYRYL